MPAKLYKREDRYDLYSEDDHKIASSASNTFGKLSKQNCDEIFWGLYDTEIEVEIEMICPHPMDTYKCGLQYGCDGDGCNHPNQIPYLDSEGCLILKRIV
jgi:hypothetical protein